jgi:cytochrome c
MNWSCSMITRQYLITIAAVLVSAVLNPAYADGNPQRGAMIYGACASCHSLEQNLQLTGPSLAGIWGKKAASVANFPRYSEALKKRDFVWDEVTLYAWLADPNAFVPGTYMTFRGIRDDKARGDLVAFLRLALIPDGAKLLVAQRLIPADEARGQAPEALETAGPEARITAIRHCRNSFFVATADGRERPFWELNLRIKVDSGGTGPKGGKPVLIPAGGQGDRVSVVFSNPAEIGRFIEEKC